MSDTKAGGGSAVLDAPTRPVRVVGDITEDIEYNPGLPPVQTGTGKWSATGGNPLRMAIIDTELMGDAQLFKSVKAKFGTNDVELSHVFPSAPESVWKLRRLYADRKERPDIILVSNRTDALDYAYSTDIQIAKQLHEAGYPVILNVGTAAHPEKIQEEVRFVQRFLREQKGIALATPGLKMNEFCELAKEVADKFGRGGAGGSIGAQV